MNRAVIFGGPSLWGLDLEPFTALEFRPPAGQGDIALAVREQFDIVGLIDGVFENGLAVWHKEILWAIEQGVTIGGASSMGALRAAECAAFGMVGIGSIYRDYAQGQRVADADVAVIHAPAAFGYQPLCVALVNVEATLEAATRHGAITSAQKDRLDAAARSLHFKARTWRSLVDAAGFEGDERVAVDGALALNAIDVKRENARELLEWTKRQLQQPRTVSVTTAAVSKTPFLAQLLRSGGLRQSRITVAEGLRLVPDCGGLIEAIAIVVPPQCLVASADSAPGRTLSALGSLARSMPHGVTLVAVTEAGADDGVARWIKTLRLRCTPEILATAQQGVIRGSDIWIQDALLVGQRQGRPIHLRPRSERSGAHAEWIASVAPQEQTDVFLPGGDMLVGPDFRLVGHYSLKQSSASLGQSDLGGARTAIEVIDDRPVHYVGYRASDLKQGATPADQAAIYQWGFHLDLSLSVTGLTENGRPVLLLAEPKRVTAAPAPGQTDGREELDATASHLEARGFRVVRNPVPRWREPLYGRIVTRVYNNVQLENALRPGHDRPLVWLPQFGGVQPELLPFDEANAAIWHDLGFEVVPVPGWEWLAGSSGAIRCASKVLRRRPGTVDNA